MVQRKQKTRAAAPFPARTLAARALDSLERAGNRLPDPALLFALALLVVWGLSAMLASVHFQELDPRTGAPIVVQNQLSASSLTSFLMNMVNVFMGFPPLGVVLVALLGVGVAEHTGLVHAALRSLLRITPPWLLTPMLMLVGILSHTAADVGFVLVIPLGGVLFAAAGRHPLAGIAAGFAGVSGGFSANLVPSGLDPMLQGITQQAIQILDPGRQVNPLCNWYFGAASSVLILLLGWFLTERVIEPRLRTVQVDGDGGEPVRLGVLSQHERRGLYAALAAAAIGLALLAWATVPDGAPLRSPEGSLTDTKAPLIRSIVPLIFFLTFVPGVIYGYVASTIKSHRDVVAGMSKSMSTMGYYLAMSFCAAQFIAAFGQSNLGALLAIKGAAGLRALEMPLAISVVGAILLTATVNLVIGSASAQWALIAPVLVPMLAQVGIAPELTQAAYRIGDSTTNIITPLMTYFPLVVVYCQRYVRGTGIGTLSALMLPYSLVFLTAWTAFLLLYWQAGLPLGLQSHYVYP